jgi:DNA gyrase subunit A
VLEGLAVALSNVDDVIALIKAAATPADAKAELMQRFWRSKLVEDLLARSDGELSRPAGLSADYGLQKKGYRLSEMQAQQILDLRLQRLTALEQDKIVAEYRETMEKIADLIEVLAKPARVTRIISHELAEVKKQYGDERRTEIVTDTQDLGMEDLIASEDVVVTLSHGGYMKSQPVADYRSQRRGGRGRQATTTKEDDFVDNLFIANTHDYILCFSNRGRVYWIKVYEVPQGSRTSRGKPVVNLVPLMEHEKITAVVPVKEFDENHYVFMATANGTVKKTALAAFSRPMAKGIIAVSLDDGDYLIGVAITDGKQDIMLFSDGGKAVRFAEDDVRAMGRNAAGVRGMRLAKGRHVIALLTAGNGAQSVLTATENGYGKRTPISDYTRHARGTQGMIAIQCSERNGPLVAAHLVSRDDEIMLITTGGVLIRTRVSEVREQGRSTQGVRLINLDEGEKLAGLEKIVEPDEEEG